MGSCNISYGLRWAPISCDQWFALICLELRDFLGCETSSAKTRTVSGKRGQLVTVRDTYVLSLMEKEWVPFKFHVQTAICTKRAIILIFGMYFDNHWGMTCLFKVILTQCHRLSHVHHSTWCHQKTLLKSSPPIVSKIVLGECWWPRSSSGCSQVSCRL